MADELPWLTFPAIDFLQNLRLAKSKVFEFGGGGSTLFFCKNGAQVSTVEDNAEWFKILTDTVAKKGYADWQGFFISPEPLPENLPKPDPGNPDNFASASPGRTHLSFEKYARSIDSYPADYFDLILVDGRARPSCFQQAIPRLKTGGYLVIDNTERTYYLARFRELIVEKFTVELDEFAPGSYVADFTKTTILRKKG